MAIGRETIYAAFFYQLQQQLKTPVGVFNYVGRRSVLPGGLSAGLYPAFFLLEQGESYERQVLFAPANVVLHAQGIIHSLAGTIPNDSPVTALNNLADAVEDAVQSACGLTADNTLGVLVQKAWINNRQVVTPPVYSNRWAVQTLSIDIALPHSR